MNNLPLIASALIKQLKVFLCSCTILLFFNCSNDIILNTVENKLTKKVDFFLGKSDDHGQI
tara:strand:- start:220 stop:402 length:183 start_codon:yes stop_codon:yes gene_type:complete